MGTFGQRLRELRNQRGISQNELSKYIGVSKSSVNMYERDEREPSFETLEAIADFFNVNMDYLLGREPHKPLENSLGEVNRVLDKFEPTQFSVSARPTLIKLFEVLANANPSDYAEKIAQMREEMYETFTLSDMKCIVSFLGDLCSALEEEFENLKDSTDKT